MTTTNPWVGRSIKRKEDRRLLVGEGQYLADLVLPRMVMMGLVRSIYAHAKITNIDSTKKHDFLNSLFTVHFQCKRT